MNTTVFQNLIKNYNELSYTHNYMFGYSDNGTIYCAIGTADALPYVCTLDRASRGAGFALRYKPTKNQKSFLRTLPTFALCSKEFFDLSVNSCKYNAGEVFEKMVTEYFGQEWKKDNVPFTDDGDLTVDGVAYQIKYEKATFINEKTLQKMRTK